NSSTLNSQFLNLIISIFTEFNQFSIVCDIYLSSVRDLINSTIKTANTNNSFKSISNCLTVLIRILEGEINFIFASFSTQFNSVLTPFIQIVCAELQSNLFKQIAYKNKSTSLNKSFAIELVDYFNSFYELLLAVYNALIDSENVNN